jgi:hypothetical protein
MGTTSSVLSGIEPRAFWEHFVKLTTIARPSRHEEPVIDYVRAWGSDLGLALPWRGKASSCSGAWTTQRLRCAAQSREGCACEGRRSASARMAFAGGCGREAVRLEGALHVGARQPRRGRPGLR